ncbi:hypothetical protein K488DRAFT_42446 [Vararia minispora EC-137]|uniref:Uncharacterized protein n=1 Tax=Vararia minispora EC-137 TaxID=1314806 RepID=A0ACB8QW04_9AGAM|nr:hypothetical protein K488DRAFT_42446 [Vararia minispora EC-137]
MFSSNSQPGTVSLFSSTSSDPLALFSIHTDPSLPSDSFVHLLADTSSVPAPDPPAVLIVPHPISSSDSAERSGGRNGYEIANTVLHIQSPTLCTTYIRSPPSYWHSDKARDRERDLGLNHPWIHLQIRNMGREWSFEVGLVDTGGREGIVRCSTFQKRPTLQLRTGRPPLLHIPLSFPHASSTPLTTWNTISLHLPSLIPHFTSSELNHDSDEGASIVDVLPAPTGRYTNVSYIVVYASCRLRRIWFSQSALSGEGDASWEMQLYTDS